MKITDAMRQAAKAFGKMGGLKSRNQKEAARASHSKAAEAKRRATRLRNGSVKLRSGKSVDSATPR